MSKRIDFISPPFSGHLNPVIAMARSVCQQYEVRVISTEKAGESVNNAGLAFVALPGDYDTRLQSIVNPAYAIGHNPLRLYRQFKAVMQLLKELKNDLEAIYQNDKPDLMVIDFTLPVAGIVAEQLGVHWWTSHPSACVIETCDGPPAYLGGWMTGDSWLIKLRNRMGRHLVRGFKRLMFNLFRQPVRALGFTRLYRENGTERVYSAERILCSGIKELEFSKCWPQAVEFIGPQLYTPSLQDTAKNPLSFDHNKKYILVTLGTHLKWYKQQAAERVRQCAARFPGYEFHFSDGDLASQVYEEQSNFKRFAFINYQQYISNYELVIHHGGANIMYYCLLYAKPSIVHPVDYDQFDHAARLSVLGVALIEKDLRQLHRSLEMALAQPGLKGNALKVSQWVKSYIEEEHFSRMVNELLA